MRFESVKAYAFGPFTNQILELAPGMNVVYGPNEAGKSSWHAALYAGLCGMRRGRGRPKDDGGFAERHRPWDDNKTWEVGALITLDGGRRVELRHDLAGRVQSSALDADIAGRDYSNDIMIEGAPDGSRWLGLDRRSFLMTACIRQSQILGLLESPSDLQDELQKAADTADREATAAEALARLREFHTENVGSERAPTKPLRATQNRIQSAERRLKQAQALHNEYLSRWARVDQLEQGAHAAEQRLIVTRASIAAAAASEAAKRLEQAQELDAHFPGGAPRRPSQDDNVVQEVASAITTWNQRPKVLQPKGHSMPELEALLAEVNLLLAVNAERAAVEFEKRVERAQELNRRFPRGRPLRPSEDDSLVQRITSVLTAWESRPEVHEPTGQTVAELESELEAIGAQLGETREPTAHFSRNAEGGPFSAIFRFIRTIFEAFLRLFGAGRREPSMQPEQKQALEERRSLLQQRIAVRDNADSQWKESLRRVQEAANAVLMTASELGVGSDSPEAAVASLLEWQRGRAQRLSEIDAQMNEWEELQQVIGQETLAELEGRAAVLRSEAVDAASRIDEALLITALDRPGPETSSESASGQEQRMALLQEIDERRRQEKEHEAASAGVAAAGEAVAKAARLAGVIAEGPDDQIEALLTWQVERSAEFDRLESEIKEWEDLQRILGQNSLEELTREVERLRTEAQKLSGFVGVDDLSELVGTLTDADVPKAERDANEARDAFIREQSQLEAFSRDLIDVAVAEEELADARKEYAGVQTLDHTLKQTIKFLEQAEERVHRNIAPVLAGTVRQWLPKVTSGRYTDCRVDPVKLAVQVAMGNGKWLAAESLSHGTAEQVYLLLRLALAQHLTTETCPLILDDAVAASDAKRKRDLLETLLSVSESTQVILFTHEEDVCAWARARLIEHPHSLTELDGPAT